MSTEPTPSPSSNANDGQITDHSGDTGHVDTLASPAIAEVQNVPIAAAPSPTPVPAAPLPLPAAALTPEEDLKAKQTALEQEQIAVLLLQEEIKAIKANIDEYTKSTAGYDADYIAVKKDRDNFTLLTNQKQEIADAVIAPSDITTIDALITNFDNKLAQGDLDVTAALTTSDAAKTAADAADAIKQTKQNAYEQLKNSLADAKTQLKEVKNLIDQANLMEAKSNFVVLHFLAKEADAQLKSDKITSIKSPEDYKTALKSAQDEAEAARKTSAQKQYEARQALAAYDALKKAQEVAHTSRRTKLLEILNDFKIPAV